MMRLWRRIACVLTVIIGFAACNDSDSTKIKAAALAEGCLINTDCAPPLVCAFRRCHTECEDSRDCDVGQRCVASDRPFSVCQLEDDRDCTSNIDCPLGMICGVDAECRDSCGTSRDCISGQLCTSGTCADEAELDDDGQLPERSGRDGATTNRPCSYSSECQTGLVCRNGACIQECREDRDCPIFTACEEGRCALGDLPFGGGSGGAGGGGGAGGAGGGDPSACTFNSDCPAGQICDRPTCRCECRENRDCFGGEQCDGCACVAPGSGSDASVGAGGNPGAGGSSAGGAGGDATDAGTGGVTVDGGGFIEPIDCGNRDTTGATVAPSDITSDTTWSGLVHITSNVRVSGGAILTIAAGATILANTGTNLEIGWNTNAATIRALGSEAAPIRLCSTQGDAGGWQGLIIRSNTSASSVLRNVLIGDGGSTNAALLIQADISIDGVQVRNSGGDGVETEDFVAGSRQLSVDGSAGTSVVLTGPGAVTRFPLGGSLTGNAIDEARVDFTIIDANANFYDLGIPYVQTGNLQVRGAATVTFSAGIDYRVAAGRQIEVGWNSGGSTLFVNGTAARPVTFRGQTAEAGSWNQFLIRPNVTAASHLTHTRILHAGSAEYALNVNTPITLDHVSLASNTGGVFISAEGLNDDSTELSVTSTEGVPLTVDPSAMVTIPPDSTLTGNDVDRIAVTTGIYDAQGTVPNVGIPYFLSGSINVRDSAVLEIAAGTEFIANVGMSFDVGWNSTPATFIAQGTAASPIVFRGLDTTNGYWDGFIFRTSTLSASVLDHVTIRHAGAVNTGAVELYKEISVTNTTVSNSAGYGIRHDAAYTTDYTSTNSFSDNTQGNVTAR